MADRPFQCPKCLNWHTPIPMPEGMMCRWCAEEKHARHPKTGEYDCHWGLITSTQSEVKIMQANGRINEAATECQRLIQVIESATEKEQVIDVLKRAEVAFALAERAHGEVGEILRWAGVMEMPGMAGEPSSKRFKSVEAIEVMVADNRRPPTDLTTLQRSVKICNEIANEIPERIAEARVSIGQVRQSAQDWRQKAPLYVKDKKQLQTA